MPLEVIFIVMYSCSVYVVNYKYVYVNVVKIYVNLYFCTYFINQITEWFRRIIISNRIASVKDKIIREMLVVAKLFGKKLLDTIRVLDTTRV